MFNAREFLARQLGCPVYELTPRDLPTRDRDGSQGQAYLRAGVLAGRVMVTGPRRNLQGQNGRLATATLAGTPSGYVHLGPDEEVSW
jgi:hypothetical protein